MALWKSEGMMAELKAIGSFNPCFSGWRSERQWFRWKHHLRRVSILVFLDGALKVLVLWVRHEREKFQSLFFWMALWKLTRKLRRAGRIRVSILVFLDGALKDQVPISSCWSHRRFNPCFSGWRSESSNWRLYRLVLSVSILVFLDGALKDKLRHSGQCGEGVSILVFLDGALKGVRSWHSPGKTKSFNPCFSGWRSERGRKLRRSAYRSRFQSLFFWMALWKLAEVAVEMAWVSFNPCFSGWRSERQCVGNWTSSSSSFNPCFSGWRSERRHSRGDVIRQPIEFQSLFFWMALWKLERNNNILNTVLLFQSLFFWMALWKLCRMRRVFLCHLVSILVFLDGALKAQNDWTKKKFWSNSFNPCFSGWRSESHHGSSGSGLSFCFNPCFSGWRSERVFP